MLHFDLALNGWFPMGTDGRFDSPPIQNTKLGLNHRSHIYMHTVSNENLVKNLNCTAMPWCPIPSDDRTSSPKTSVWWSLLPGMKLNEERSHHRSVGHICGGNDRDRGAKNGCLTCSCLSGDGSMGHSHVRVLVPLPALCLGKFDCRSIAQHTLYVEICAGRHSTQTTSPRHKWSIWRVSKNCFWRKEAFDKSDI